MTNLEKYNETFCEVLNVEIKNLKNITYQSVSAWDSIGHMNLISSLEEKFEIMMDTDDIVDFNSYTKGIEILKKYDIEF